jgi:hypothetical protein
MWRCEMFRYLLAILLQALPAGFSSAPAGDPPCLARPPEDVAVHSIGNIALAVSNMGRWGDPYGDFPSMEWPNGQESMYIWNTGIWASCYGQITPGGTAAKYASISDYGRWEFYPSDGFPLVYSVPGSTAPEQSGYGIDDWYEGYNETPFGLQILVSNYTWPDAGYDEFLVTDMRATHHAEFGYPGSVLDGFVLGILGDCDVATADPDECNLDDLVYFDGHAIWGEGGYGDYDYRFDDGTLASEQDDYILQENPDATGGPLYQYNYIGSDGIPDNDTDENGVSDHFTILAKVADGDTSYVTDPATGIVMFEEGFPYFHLQRTVGDTTYLVVPRNLAYMWDGDNTISLEDDTGEPSINPPCDGFVGFRLMDLWVAKAGGVVERPGLAMGANVPLSFEWWNWEMDPGDDPEIYDIMWGLNWDGSGTYSGPSFMADWAGNPDTPEAMAPDNPGPFPFALDNPHSLGHPCFDYRFLISCAPVTLEDGDTLHVVGGWVVGEGLEGLRRNADMMLDAYYRSSIWGGGLGTGDGAQGPGGSLRILGATPNPASAAVTVVFEAPSGETPLLTVYDMSGRAVAASRPVQCGEVTMDLGSLPAGVYVVVLGSDSGRDAARLVLLR